MTITTEKDLAALRRIGRIVAECLQAMGDAIEPGMTTAELDEIGRVYLEERGARSAPALFYDFPGTTCISVNREIAHGVPGAKKVRAGDLVNIDVSAELGGFVADTGGTFIVPPETAAKRRLCDVTRAARDGAIAAARAGRRLNVIGETIESTAEAEGFSIIRNLGSHGVGRKLHEAPEFIAPYRDPRDKRMLKAGMVITVEPFLSTGATYAEEADDGWTLMTVPRQLAAQYEHTIVITKGDPIIITATR